MTTLHDWFNRQRDILLSRYQLPSIRGICPAFDRLDYGAKDLKLRMIEMSRLSPLLPILQEIQNHIQYGSIPIPDHSTGLNVSLSMKIFEEDMTSYLNQCMSIFEENLDSVDETVEEIEELHHSESVGSEEHRK